MTSDGAEISIAGCVEEMVRDPNHLPFFLFFSSFSFFSFFFIMCFVLTTTRNNDYVQR